MGVNILRIYRTAAALDARAISFFPKRSRGDHMRPFVVAKLLGIAAVCILGGLAGTAASETNPQATSNAEDAELIKTLQANWDSQRSAIVTARFRARAFRHGSLKPLPQREVEAVFASVDFASQPDDLRKVVSAICTLKEFSTPDPWSVIEVTVDGARRRERTTNTPQGIDDNVVDQGITVTGMGPAKQTSIMQTGPGSTLIRGLDDFRFIPISAKGFVIAARDADVVRLSCGDPGGATIKLDVDETTGFVHSFRLLLDDGTVAREVLQFGAVTHPGDLVLPTAIATMTYTNGMLSHADVLVIEEAEVNIDLPPDAFAIKAIKGTLIADYRNPEHKDVFYARSDIDDVGKAFPLNGSQYPKDAEQSPAALLFAAGAALLALLVFFYRRPKQ